MIGLGTNLEGYWKFDESSGNASDSSGNSNTLTNVNTTAYAAGKIRNGADFESTSTNYFEIADGSQTGLDITGDIGASFWVKPESTLGISTQRVLFGKFTSFGNQRSYSLRYRNESGTLRLILLINDDGYSSEDYIWNQTLNTATWYHVVVTWKASTSTAELWVDNTSIGTQSGAKTSIHSGTAPFTVAAVNSGGDPFDGVIDELAIYSRLLNDGDVSKLYNGGKGLQHPFNYPVTSAA